MNQGRMCISSVTLMELIYGAEKSQMPERNLAVIEGFVSRLDVLDYDTPAATHTGQIRADQGRACPSGTPCRAIRSDDCRSRTQPGTDCCHEQHPGV
ncbi:hypothetical protein VW603_004389 [Salmonella enterica]|nr:hypothetical protein [Salmonella enterica]